MRSVLPDFVVEFLGLLHLEGGHLVEHFRLVEADQVVDDDVRGPEVVDHVPANVDLTLGPVRGAVQNHAWFGPQQFVGQAEADLLQRRENSS